MPAEVCLGLRLHVPFWCSFRDPAASNVHRTFPVPPPTTVYGLVAAALGLRQDDYSLRGRMRFAVAVESLGEVVETYSKWMKAAEGPKDAKQIAAWEATRGRGLLSPGESLWISTPIIRQKLVQPVFCAGILTSPDLADEIGHAIADPFFPLCLGESDDVVDVEVLPPQAPAATDDAATGAVTGVVAGGMLANLPTRFVRGMRSKWSLESWLVTVPRPGMPVRASRSLVRCHGHVWEFDPPAGR